MMNSTILGHISAFRISYVSLRSIHRPCNLRFFSRSTTSSFTAKNPLNSFGKSKSFKSDDTSVETDELLSENNPWSPTFEDDPIYVQERGKIRRTKLPEKYRLSYKPIYEAPSSKYVSLLKRLTLTFGVVGAYGSKLIYESVQFDDSYAYTLIAGTLIPIVIVQWKTRDYVTRMFRLYDKTKPQTLDNLVSDEKIIAEKLNFTGGKTYNELVEITNNPSLKLSPKPRWWKPYSSWEEKSSDSGKPGGLKREFYVMDNIGGIKMDRLWGIVERNSGVDNGRTFLNNPKHYRDM